jgi:crotonobetainyl-CoA:carnitine CoA-transferase CaiB-like acyl-CoA transferase
LSGLRVVEATEGIAGGYAAKLLVDMGAEVVKVERRGGDPLRRWSAAHPDSPAEGDSALFSYLAAGKSSVGSDELPDGLGSWADVIFTGPRSAQLLGDRWQDGTRDDTAVVSVTPFGLDGPLAATLANEFTLQAWCGLISACGTDSSPPLWMGAGPGQWATGATAALAALAVRRTRVGAEVDVSSLEVMAVCLNNYPTLYRQFTGSVSALSRGGDWLSVVPCKDGWIGLCLFTAQQWADFAVMIGREDLAEDERLRSMGARGRHRDFVVSVVAPWLAAHTAAEIHELGGLFRVPVAFVGTGRSVLEMDHLVERHVFVANPGSFRQPRPPFLMSRSPTAPIGRAPRFGECSISVGGPAGDPAGGPARGLATHPGDDGVTPVRPLAGVTVLDLTAFWAGPYATHLLATLGADVIKVESPNRPDGMRFATVAAPDTPSWLEFGPTFHGTNPAKRSVTIDFSTPAGRELVLRLATHADVVVENFASRVLANVGLDYETLSARRADLIVLRMPGFGVDGPWRNHAGFAQTMEQVSGIGWMTGMADGQPLVRSTIDPISGIHGAFAVLAALAYRDRTGEGQLIEQPMLEVALNIAAEAIVAYSAEGATLCREGNRGPGAAPQGVYACTGDGQWIALAVESDEQWVALTAFLGNPGWAGALELVGRAGRRAHHDHIDAELGRAFVALDRDAAVKRLLAAGIPAAPVWNQMIQDQLPQLIARGFNQPVPHPVAGTVLQPGIGFRSSRLDLGYRTHAPLLGQHTREVLSELLNLAEPELLRLAGEGVIEGKMT